MGDSTETNIKVLCGERCGSTTNAYTEKSLYAQNGPFSGTVTIYFIGLLLKSSFHTTISMTGIGVAKKS